MGNKAAEYYVRKGYEVYVLNRNTREQSAGVNLIQADRHNLGNILDGYDLDVVVDTAYTSEDVDLLLDGLADYRDYILISSGAVYPEYGAQPFKEDEPVNGNTYWGKYGTDKGNAENALIRRNPQDRCFYLPKNGEMKL